MSSTVLFSFVIGYFLVLLVVAYFTSRNSNNDSFFIGNKKSNWLLVAFGMVGTSLSGVTFISVPGTVGSLTADGTFKAFGYFQVVLGNFIGYCIIAFVLLPLYYRLNLTSIYNYLEHRFGRFSYKTGALFFIISRTIGATARLFLVINVLHLFILKDMHIPFALTSIVILAMILLYTFEGGVKTIVWTDTLQTTFMLVGLVVCVGYILSHMDFSLGEAMSALDAKHYSKIFNMNMDSPSFFLKQVLGGAFITIGMTGLDQEMMQKNISVKTLGHSQRNMMTFNIVSVMVNFLFLLLGGLLYLFVLNQGAQYQDGGLLLNGKNIMGDDLFPTVALHYLPSAISVVFIIGLISALFPSADGALTALTSSFCIDLLGLRKRDDLSEKQKRRTRLAVHLSFTIIFLICILVFKAIDNKSIIYVILDLAGYTYGPLLGLFAFGILTRRQLSDSIVVTVICLAAPICCYLLKGAIASWTGYTIGLEMLLINGSLTFLGLLSISKKRALTN